MLVRKKDSRPLTKADKEAALNLKTLFERSEYTQRSLGIAYGNGDESEQISQSAVSQYLHGKVPLGTIATMRFARCFECHPTDIRPDFSYSDMVPGDIPPDILKIAAELSLLSPEVRADVAEIVNDIRKHGSSYHQLLRKFRNQNA